MVLKYSQIITINCYYLSRRAPNRTTYRKNTYRNLNKKLYIFISHYIIVSMIRNDSSTFNKRDIKFPE